MQSSLIRKFDNKQKQFLREQRIVKKDLVYVIGLSQALAWEDILTQKQFFGQYGRVRKVVINKEKPFVDQNNLQVTYSAFITYQSFIEAALAILAVDQCVVEQTQLKASFGMAKYCTFFVNNAPCNNFDCLYLHKVSWDWYFDWKEDHSS